MAVENGFLFSIDASFVKNLEKADKALENFSKSSDKVAANTIKAFTDITTKGVNPMVSNLEKKVESFNTLIASIGDSKDSGLVKMKNDAISAVDEINKLISALKKTDSYKEGVNIEKYTSILPSSKGRGSEIKTEIEALDRYKVEMIKAYEDIYKSSKTIEDRRYQEWLYNKKLETDAHKNAEDEKLKATIDSIAQQNAAYRNKTLSNEAKANTDAAINNYREQYRAYEQLFDEAIRRENKLKADAANNELNLFLKNQDKKKQAEQDMRSIERRNHEAKVKEYEEMFRQLDRTEQRVRNINRAYGDSSKGALNYANRVLSGQKPKTLNNMQTALSKLQEAQNRLNLDTAAGRKRYAELEQAIKRVKSNIDLATNSSSKLKEEHKKLSETANTLQRNFAAVFSVQAIAGYAKKVIDVTGEFEMQHTAMQNLIGDVDKANKIWDKTIKLAVNSPFRVKELVTYTKQLSAYRIETDKLYDKTKMLADISAGLGVDMNRLILAYGQVKAANYLRGTELRQFSEAGINILKELSDYYTEIEKKTVSVGDVFERVSKRMVSFADVDTVLQRVTSKGREFYKMQEKQAETILGLRMNLQDSIDLMMNDIGSSNRDVIKDSIRLMKTLVDNWRTVSTFAYSGIIAFSIQKINKALRGMSLSMIAASKSAATFELKNIFLARTFRQLTLSIKTLGKAMYANPLFWPLASIAAIGTLTAAIVSHSREVKRLNKRYEESAVAETRRRKRLEDIAESIKENNKVIDEYNKKQSKSAEDTEKNNAAIEANEAALEKLKNQYPEIVNGLSVQENKTIDMTDALEEYNKKLRINIALQHQAKGGFFKDDLYTNYEDVLKKQSATASQVNKMKALGTSMMTKAELAFYNGEIGEEEYESIRLFIRELEKASSASDILALDLSALKTKAFRGLSLGVNEFVNENSKLVSILGAENRAYNRLGQNIQEQSSSIILALNGINNAADRGRWVNTYLEDFNIVDESVREWAKEEIKKYVTLEIIYPEDNNGGGGSLEPWAERVSAAISKINEKIKKESPQIEEKQLFPLPSVGQTREQYLDLVSETLKVAKQTYDKNQQIVDESTVNATKALNPYADEVERILNIYKENKDDGAKDFFNKRINLIKNLREEYLKLIKTFNEDISFNKVVDSYADSMKELGLNILDVDFTTETGLIKYLKSLEKMASQYGTEAKFALQKAIGDIQVEIDTKITKENQEKTIKDIEDMFGSYDISLEMEKLNIPPDLAKQLFGVDAISLKDIKNKIVAKLETARAQGGQEDYIKELEHNLKKVDELEDKYLKDRAKEYIKYLRAEQDERIKLKMSEIQKLADIERMYQEGLLTKVQADTMTGNVRKETTTAVEKSRWKDFEKSAAYLQLFDNISESSTYSLEKMKQNLEELRKSMMAAGIPASDLKEILSQIENVEDELENRNPFGEAWNNLRTLFGGYKDYKRAREEEKVLLEEEARLLKEKKALEDAVAAEQKQGGDTQALARLRAEEQLLATLNVGTEEYERQLDLIEHIKNNLYPATEEYNNIDKALNSTQESLSIVNSEVKKWKEATREIAEGFENVGNAILNITSELSDTLVKTGHLTEDNKAIVDSMLNVGGDIVGVGSDVLRLVANPADLQAWVGLITNSISLVGNLAETADAKRQKEINAEAEKLERLEKSYERLETAMDEAYSTSEVNRTYDDATESINAQIAALEKQKALEESKKNSDTEALKGYSDAIDELILKKEELEKERAEKHGANFDVGSIAESFVDAWTSAFEETGDGLKGLEEEWDEFYQNLIKQQAAKRYVKSIIDPLIGKINEDLADGVLDKAEELQADANDVLGIVDKYMQNINQIFGAFGNGDVSMSGLSEGISGMTEDQANILAAYWNAVRGNTASIDLKLDTIIANMNVGGDNNPMLSALNSILTVSTNIHTLLENASNPSDTNNAINVRLV